MKMPAPIQIGFIGHSVKPAEPRQNYIHIPEIREQEMDELMAQKNAHTVRLRELLDNLTDCQPETYHKKIDALRGKLSVLIDTLLDLRDAQHDEIDELLVRRSMTIEQYYRQLQCAARRTDTAPQPTLKRLTAAIDDIDQRLRIIGTVLPPEFKPATL